MLLCSGLKLSDDLPIRLYMYKRSHVPTLPTSLLHCIRLGSRSSQGLTHHMANTVRHIAIHPKILHCGMMRARGRLCFGYLKHTDWYINCIIIHVSLDCSRITQDRSAHICGDSLPPRYMSTRRSALAWLRCLIPELFMRVRPAVTSYE